MNTKLCAASDTPISWNQIDFKEAERRVKKLQKRIALAYQNDDVDKARSLQHKLTHSFDAKALAVKIVSSNRGKHTSGIDNMIWDTYDKKIKAIDSLRRRGYKPKPLRRINIPKSDGTMRPLSIPTMRDRAMMTLYKFTIEPIAEITADSCSFGYRPNRSARDALTECLNILSKSSCPAWIMKSDIKSCFDNISHEWILEHIPMDKVILRKFLKCGYVEYNKFFQTEKGIPQGGSLSSIICNMVLDGMEKLLVNEFGENVRLIRYADDFIVTGISKNFLVQFVVPVIQNFLLERRLALSKEKTIIIPIAQGFTFLGWQVYKRDGQIIAVPSQRGINSLLEKITAIAVNPLYDSRDKWYKPLKQIIKGWMNYYAGIAVQQSLYGVEFEVVLHLNNLTSNNKIVENTKALFALYDR